MRISYSIVTHDASRNTHDARRTGRRFAIGTYKRLPRGKKKPDELIHWSVPVISFIREHARLLGWVATVIVLLLIVFIVENRVSAHRMNKSLVAFYKVQMLPQGSEKQQNALKELIKDYGSTSAGREAMILLGNQLFKQGDYAGALEQFETLVKNSRGNTLLMIESLHRVALSQRALNKMEDAAKTYLTAANEPGNLNMVESLYLAAQCYEEIKQYDEAAKIYRRVIDSPVEGNMKSLSEERLLWLISNGLISG